MTGRPSSAGLRLRAKMTRMRCISDQCSVDSRSRRARETRSRAWRLKGMPGISPTSAPLAARPRSRARS